MILPTPTPPALNESAFAGVRSVLPTPRTTLLFLVAVPRPFSTARN